MSDIAIKVENLGKSYLVGHNNAQNENYTALRDVISHNVKNLARKTRDMIVGRPIVQGDEVEDFWALKDINFEIKQGDRVGIIGRNGAGKSTLLKILSRITEPTAGRISIHGRVASLLEVGTGFHPELTGRENIFLNGAILGMSRNEIKRKFDEIVYFAEIEKFLDTPVKRYSSGMYVRLAFSVAAHLEPEILVVDEVLAVGDAKFQAKCLGKMEDVGNSGRTVLFVSHQMTTIKRLCQNSILLNSGSIIYKGSTNSCIEKYLNSAEIKDNTNNLRLLTRSGNNQARISRFYISNSEENKINTVCTGDDITLVFEFDVLTEGILKNISVGFSLHNYLGETIAIFYSDYSGILFESEPGNKKVKCEIRKLPLTPGKYYVGYRMTSNENEVDWPKEYIGSFNVEQGDYYESGRPYKSGQGIIMIDGNWLES